jgi:protein-tyrosine phosphatase
MSDFKFTPARASGDVICGARRPGYPDELVGQSQVDDWIAYMKEHGIRRVCCLLSSAHLDFYEPGLLDQYRNAFDEDRVLSAPVEDYHLCDQSTLDSKILPFLIEADKAGEPTVVHCSGGSGRTGHVLAAWLVRRRGLSVCDALESVCATNRDPFEAVNSGHATKEQLYALLEGPQRASSCT